MRTRIETIREINELLEQYNVPVWSEKDFTDWTFTGVETLSELQGIASDIANDYHESQAYKKLQF